jgi:TonB family protein
VPDRIDLNPYLHRLYSSIRRKAELPESALNGERGVVVVRVHIEKDGSLPNGTVRIVSSSRKKDMDAAAKSSILKAAPFGPLPEGYGPNLDLLFTFYYNSEPQKPAQEPQVVPVGTTFNHVHESIQMERP